MPNKPGPPEAAGAGEAGAGAGADLLAAGVAGFDTGAGALLGAGAGADAGLDPNGLPREPPDDLPPLGMFTRSSLCFD